MKIIFNRYCEYSMSPLFEYYTLKVEAIVLYSLDMCLINIGPELNQAQSVIWKKTLRLSNAIPSAVIRHELGLISLSARLYWRRLNNLSKMLTPPQNSLYENLSTMITEKSPKSIKKYYGEMLNLLSNINATIDDLQLRPAYVKKKLYEYDWRITLETLPTLTMYTEIAQFITRYTPRARYLMQFPAKLERDTYLRFKLNQFPTIEKIQYWRTTPVEIAHGAC